MALLKFISLSVGSLLLFQGAYADPSKNTAQKDEACVGTMNTARQEVGLPNFTPTTSYLTGDSSQETVDAICAGLQKTPASPGPTRQATSGTVAYHVQTNHNCSEAVAKWKQGFSAFSSYTSSVPPAFQSVADTANNQLGASPYNTEDAINFAALYSAKPDATAECAFVTCPAGTGTDETARTSASEAKAMVCITYPDAVKADGAAPWTEEQWKKILAVFDPSSSSANAAVPTLLALAAAAVAVALM